LPTSLKTESLFASKLFLILPFYFWGEAFVGIRRMRSSVKGELHPPIHQVSYDRAKEKPRPDSLVPSWRRRVTHLSLSVHEPSVTKKTCRLAGEWRHV
jgi:hypothetical protein